MSLDEELFEAVKKGDIDKVRELLRRGASVKARNEYGGTPLHYAALRGHVDVARLLLERGADVNAKSMYDATPLHVAAFVGYADVARILLEHGADPGIRNRDGKTPLDIAREKGHKEVARVIEEFMAQGRRDRGVGVVATPTTVSAQELVAVAPSILGVESPGLYIGKWGRLLVRLRGLGTATLSIEGDVDWLDPGRVQLSSESVVEVPVRPRAAGELPVRVVVKSSGGEDAKITWLKVVEKAGKCSACDAPIEPGAKYCWNCGAKLG